MDLTTLQAEQARIQKQLEARQKAYDGVGGSGVSARQRREQIQTQIDQLNSQLSGVRQNIDLLASRDREAADAQNQRIMSARQEGEQARNAELERGKPFAKRFEDYQDYIAFAPALVGATSAAAMRLPAIAEQLMGRRAIGQALKTMKTADDLPTALQSANRAENLIGNQDSNWAKYGAPYAATVPIAAAEGGALSLVPFEYDANLPLMNPEKSAALAYAKALLDEDPTKPAMMQSAQNMRGQNESRQMAREALQSPLSIMFPGALQAGGAALTTATALKLLTPGYKNARGEIAAFRDNLSPDAVREARDAMTVQDLLHSPISPAERRTAAKQLGIPQARQPRQQPQLPPPNGGPTGAGGSPPANQPPSVPPSPAGPSSRGAYSLTVPEMEALNAELQQLIARQLMQP